MRQFDSWLVMLAAGKERRSEAWRKKPHSPAVKNYLALLQAQPLPQRQIDWHLHASPQVQRSNFVAAQPQLVFSQRHVFCLLFSIFFSFLFLSHGASRAVMPLTVASVDRRIDRHAASIARAVEFVVERIGGARSGRCSEGG